MATFLRLGTGPLTADRIYQDDAAAQVILLRFADYIDAQGTNQQRLQAVVDHLIGTIQQGAKKQQISVEQAAMIANADEGNRLG